MVHDFTHEHDGSPAGSPERSEGFAADAEAAQAFARSESPVGISSASESEGPDGAAREYFDSFRAPMPGQEAKRDTVIRRHRRGNSLQKGEDGNVVSASEDEEDEEDELDTPIASKRQTVIGPSRVNGNYAPAATAEATNGGAEEDDEDGAMDDNEVRHVSPHQRPIQVA
jgi:hypothetical protein